MSKIFFIIILLLNYNIYADISQRDIKFLCLCKSTDCGDFQYIVKQLVKKKRIKSLKESYEDIVCQDSLEHLIPHTIKKGFLFDLKWMVKQGVSLNKIKNEKTYLDVLREKIKNKIKSPDEDNPNHWKDAFKILRNTSQKNFAKFSCEISNKCSCSRDLNDFGIKCSTK